jgi:hypothetical protein
MIRVHRRPLRLVAAVLTVGVIGAACGSPSSSSKGEVSEPTTTTIARGPETTAAQLRSRLAGLLGEHVYLAAATTGAIAGGRADEVSGASAAVAANSDAITANFAAIFGDEAGETFGPLWKRHVDLVAAYAQGSGSAVNDLAQYARDFGAFINSLVPSLPAEAVTSSVGMHEQTLRAVIDAQKAGNENEAYTALRAAAAHVNTMAGTLTGGIAKTDPDKIGGDPASKGAELLTTLNFLLREHVFLADGATNAVLGGRDGEFTAAGAALDANSEALVAAIAGVYGPEGGRAFSPLWKKHISFLVEYAKAVRDKYQPKADEAMGSLLAYTEEFGAFINTASPKLTKDAVADLVKTHVLTLKDVIDAQAAKKWSEAFALARTAADHMAMIATGLATTIVAQFPQNF